MKKHWKRWLLFEMVITALGVAFFMRRRMAVACEPEIESTLGEPVAEAI